MVESKATHLEFQIALKPWRWKKGAPCFLCAALIINYLLVEQAFAKPHHNLPLNHLWEFSSAVHFGGGVNKIEGIGGVFDLGVSGEASFGPAAWRKRFELQRRIGTWADLRTASFSTFEPSAGLFFRLDGENFKSTSEYSARPTVALRFGAGYAVRPKVGSGAQIVTSLLIGYHAFRTRDESQDTCVPDEQADICQVDRLYSSGIQAFVSAHAFTSGPGSWEFTFGIQFEPLWVWSSLASIT